MPFGVVSGVGRGIDVLDGDGYRRKGRGSFGANVGRPVVTIGTLLHSCARATRSSQITLGEDLFC